MTHRRVRAVGFATLGITAAFATSAAAASAPTITSVKETVSGKHVTITVKTKYFTIDAKDVGKKPIAGKGHEHFAMDHGKYDYPKYSGPNGTLAKKLGVQGKYSPSVTNKVTYTGLPKGKHTVVVYLARNNHAMYPNKAATKSLTFTVK